MNTSSTRLRSSKLVLCRLENRLAPASFQGLGFSYFPQALSADGGSVVGSDGTQAYRWMATTGVMGLGNLPGGSYATAYGVSGDGAVVVGAGQNSAGQTEAFRWTSSTGMVGLGTLVGGTASEALGVSAYGSVVVGFSNTVTNDEAFRWTAASGEVGLGFLPGGTFSRATGVSADGSVIVGYADSSAGTQAFRWTSSGGMIGLGHLPGTTSSQASAVSADGASVVGFSGTFSPQAFRWTLSGGMLALGFVTGTSTSRAIGVSSDGSTVVGYSGPPEGPPFNFHAFHWTVSGGMKDLRNELVTTYGLSSQLTGWYLTQAVGCSGDGQVVVGHGFDGSGNTETWMARLAPPAHVVNVQINDGAAQRSRVTSLKVNFDSAVTLPANPASAFQLERQSDSAIVSLNANVSGNSVTLSFIGGPIEFGSLADGRYTLKVLASMVNGGNFDGNGDGTAGDDYVLASAATPNPPTNIFRLFGDINGDGTVSASDFIDFRQYFGGYVFAFDFDGDASVSASDFAQFRLRFGGSI
jgi:probable HAF family extracellular repeat protein